MGGLETRSKSSSDARSVCQKWPNMVREPSMVSLTVSRSLVRKKSHKADDSDDDRNRQERGETRVAPSHTSCTYITACLHSVALVVSQWNVGEFVRMISLSSDNASPRGGLCRFVHPFAR